MIRHLYHCSYFTSIIYLCSRVFLSFFVLCCVVFHFFCFDFRENDDVIYLVICVNHKYKLGLGGQGGKPNTQINRYQIHKYTKGHIKLGARKFVYLCI